LPASSPHAGEFLLQEWMAPVLHAIAAVILVCHLTCFLAVFVWAIVGPQSILTGDCPRSSAPTYVAESRSALSCMGSTPSAVAGHPRGYLGLVFCPFAKELLLL